MINVQPQATSVSVGADTVFSVSASGDAPLSYQWRRNGVDVPGATGPQITVAKAQWDDSGSSWSVVVKNGAGSAISAGGTLRVSGTALLAGSLLAKTYFEFNPVGIAPDGSGGAYVLDTGTTDSLLRVSAQGVSTRLALKANDTAAALNQPTGMARDAAGNFYVADRTCSIRKISPAGDIAILAGSPYRCGSDDGAGGAATIQLATSAIAVDKNDRVFIANRGTVRRISPDGTVVTIAGVADMYGSVDGTGSAARFGGTQSMTVDSAGNLYVTDTGVTGTAPSVRKITPGGLVTTLAGGRFYGASDDKGSAASFGNLAGLVLDKAGNLYVADLGIHLIRKITPEGVVTRFAGVPTFASPPDTNPIDGQWYDATFRRPAAMTVDADGAIFVAESDSGLGYSALRTISVDGFVTTFGGSQAGRGTTDGSVASARFAQPRAVAVDPAGTVWIADTENRLVRQISASRRATTVAGEPFMTSFSDFGDGKGTGAHFILPRSITVDSKGTAFVTDGGRNTIRKVLGDGTVTTVAGTPNSNGGVDGVGTAARFPGIQGIVADRNGILYVSDNSAVRRIDPLSRAVTTLAGTPGYPDYGSADGTGAAASFGYLSAIAIDSAGNLYVADSVNNNIRKITPGGVVTTLAGKAGVTGAVDGQGAAASFNHPQGIAVDGAGNVYVADTDNQLIRRITPAGSVTTVAGQAGANGNLPGPLGNPLSQPTGLAFDANGILYVCSGNAVLMMRF